MIPLAIIGALAIIGLAVLAFRMRHAAEAELARERFFVKTLLENIPDHIYFKDLDSRFLRINKSMAAVFKLNSPHDAIGKTDFDFFLPEHARQAFEDEQAIINTGKPLVNREEKETSRSHRSDNHADIDSDA